MRRPIMPNNALGTLVDVRCADIKNLDRVIIDDDQQMIAFRWIKGLHEQVVNLLENSFSGIHLTEPPTRIAPICHILEPR